MAKTQKELEFLNGKDSKDEVYVGWYLQELKDAGILIDFDYHPETFHLLDGYYYHATEERPRSKKEHQYTLTIPHDYTPDYLMRWNPVCEHRHKLSKLLTCISDHYFIMPFNEVDNKFFRHMYKTYIDVKGGYDKNSNDARLFEFKRALMLEKHKINIQKVVVSDLFKHTFTPKRFMMTDGGKQSRKINWKILTLDEFLRR